MVAIKYDIQRRSLFGAAPECSVEGGGEEKPIDAIEQ